MSTLETSFFFEDQDNLGWANYSTGTVSYESQETFNESQGSLKMTHNGDTNYWLGKMENNVTFISGEQYEIKAMVYIPTSWDGGRVRLTHGSSLGDSTQAPQITTRSDMSIRDEWQEIKTLFTVGNDTVGRFYVYADGAQGNQQYPNAGDFIYMDNVIISKVTDTNMSRYERELEFVATNVCPQTPDGEGCQNGFETNTNARLNFYLGNHSNQDGFDNIDVTIKDVSITKVNKNDEGVSCDDIETIDDCTGNCNWIQTASDDYFYTTGAQLDIGGQALPYSSGPVVIDEEFSFHNEEYEGHWLWVYSEGEILEGTTSINNC